MPRFAVGPHGSDMDYLYKPELLTEHLQRVKAGEAPESIPFAGATEVRKVDGSLIVANLESDGSRCGMRVLAARIPLIPVRGLASAFLSSSPSVY